MKTCAPFQGALNSIQIKGYVPAPAHLNLPPGTFVIALLNRYVDLNGSTDPLQRSYLGRVRFDHAFSVAGTATEPGTCGGLEHGMCFRLLPEHTIRLDEGAAEVPFTIGNGRLTAKGGCLAVPAATTTWGAIKSQYRH